MTNERKLELAWDYLQKAETAALEVMMITGYAKMPSALHQAQETEQNIRRAIHVLFESDTCETCQSDES